MIPQIYDIRTDERRDVTQEDVDRLQHIAALFGRIPEDIREVYRPVVGADGNWIPARKIKLDGYRGTIYGDGIHGTDEICGELSEGV